MRTTKGIPKLTEPFRNIRKHITNPFRNDDISVSYKPLAVAQEETYSKSIVPHMRPLSKYDKKLDDINERAVKAFHEGNKELYTKTILRTKSLYTRDDAVRVAAEVGWMDVVEKLLIRKTNMSYRYPVWTTAFTSALAKLSNDCNLGTPSGRWHLKLAVLSAVKKDKEDVFNLLAPIVGVSFTDICSWDVVKYVSTSQLDPDIKKRWLGLIVKYMDKSTSFWRLESAIIYCGQFQLTEHLPYLMDCLFFANRKPTSGVVATLTIAIRNRHLEVAHCIIDYLKKASIPVDAMAMRTAVIVEDIDMVLYLYHNGCHSFPLQSYGYGAEHDLRRFLSKNGREDLYPLIVIGECQTRDSVPNRNHCETDSNTH